jgi:List-Bact-rpt repeat protein
MRRERKAVVRGLIISFAVSIWTIAALGAPTPAPATDSAGRVTHQRPSKRPVGRSPEAGTDSAATVNPVYFSDDFENGLSKWIESGGYWGTVTCDYRSTTTSVSATPVSGASCPTNYPLNVNAILEIPPANAIDLGNATHPYLSFWHKYSIAATCLGGPLYCYWYYDYGYVEVSTNYGVSWTKIASFTGEITSWTPQELDLTPYIGNKILVRFRLWDGGYGNVGWGWLLDDVEVREKGTLNVGLTVSSSPSGGGTVTLNSPPPEGGINCPPTCSELWPANWNLSGHDWALIDTDYETPPASISASPNGNYALYENATLELANAVDISKATAPALSYWDKYSIAATCLGGPLYCYWYYDYGYVEVSQDYGVTWTQLTKTTGLVSSWTPETVDLTPYITGGPILIRFRLWDGGYGNVGWGWKVDDIEITDLPTGTVYFSDNFSSTTSVPNFSDVTLTATPSEGYTFESWTGCNSTSGNECTINRYIDRVVTATFLPPYKLSVSVTGNGTVVSGNLDCGSICSQLYPQGTQVQLTALPGPGSTLSGWSGCDTINGDLCTVTMSGPRNVTATFATVQVTLLSLTLQPASVTSGLLSIATLTLGAPAPTGGLGVGISSNNMRYARPPALVEVPGGATSVRFAVRTFPVGQKTVAQITATANASHTGATLTLNPR